MGIENLQRWHWIIVGIFVGLVIAYVRLGVEPDAPRSVGLPEFENIVSQSHPVGADGKTVERRMVKAIVLHPTVPDGAYKKPVQTVTFMRDTYTTENGVKGWKYVPSALVVELPFGRNGQTEFGGSFQGYLEEVAKNDPQVTFRYAWWEQAPAQYGLWTAGCALVIGGVWPTVVNVLIGAGFARPPKTKSDYDLERFGKYKEEQAKAAPKTMSAAEQEQLARVNATLEKELAPSGNRMNIGIDPSHPAEQPVKKLDGKELEIVQIEQEDEDKEYKGEFYPVARPVHQHHDGPEEKKA